ncbi:MAG: hypothetical protein ACI9ZX_002126 [Algoriphagus sp.]|jgi:hypothetical protein
MNIIDIINYFPDEESCEIYLKEHREKARIRCKGCEDITGSAEPNFSNAAYADAEVLSKAVR